MSSNHLTASGHRSSVAFTGSSSNRTRGWTAHTLTMTPQIDQTDFMMFVATKDASTKSSFVLDDVWLEEPIG